MAPEAPASASIGTAEQGILAVRDLIENAADYEGMEVQLQGKILTQCIRGCQFTLDDGTGVVGVELVDDALENVLMRGSVGRTVLLRGVVEASPRPLVLVEDREGWGYVD